MTVTYEPQLQQRDCVWGGVITISVGFDSSWTSPWVSLETDDVDVARARLRSATLALKEKLEEVAA